MSKRNFTVDILSASSVKSLMKELETYRTSTLPQKCQQAVQELSKQGISVARQNTGDFGHYITFYTKLEQTSEAQCQAVLVATNTGMIKREWQTLEGVKSVDVNPLLMAEFGSGYKAQNPKGIIGVGQGTFPGQTHAFDKNGWYWQDLDGNWNHSTGIEPTAPVYKAWEYILATAESVMKEVFG